MTTFTDMAGNRWELREPVKRKTPVVLNYEWNKIIGNVQFDDSGGVHIHISDPRVVETMRVDAVTITTPPARPLHEDHIIGLQMAVSRIEELEAENAKMRERLDYWDSWTYLGGGSSGKDRYMELVQRGTAGQ